MDPSVDLGIESSLYNKKDDKETTYDDLFQTNIHN